MVQTNIKVTLVLIITCLLFVAKLAAAFPPRNAPLPPREAAAAITVPDGFKVTLFAGEPDVAQPIAMCFDDRGRLWVAECHTYPNWIKDGRPGNDRIVIFEDTDNDGVFDKRTVFLDKLANLTSIEFGFGGLYALTAPNLIHIPIDKTGDRPAGPAKILLDGWSLDTRHNIVNGLKWGPDGWLYGCHGILATSHAGAPGTPKDKRPPINCGVWRFHPVTHKYEIVCNGGTNPWGIDWDEQGELYFTNCVIDHAFHVIPGGHYQRMFGNDFNPHLYKLMGSCVDHLHWGGGHWTDSRATDKGSAGKHSEAGGGHAHSGCMIYLGDNFPKEYRNTLFTGNIHGNRINRDRIDYGKHGPVLRHEKDFLFGNDPWFRPIAINYGPDGGVYVMDWTDTGECHNYDKVHRTSGRIYKVIYGKSQPKRFGRSTASTRELFQLHDSDNEWDVRGARRILLERYQAGTLKAEEWGTAVAEFAKRDSGRPETVESKKLDLRRSVRLLQTRIALQSADPTVEIARFGSGSGLSSEIPMSLVLKSLFETSEITPKLIEMLDLQAVLAKTGYARQSRLALASALRRFEPKDRWTLAAAMAQNAADRDDPEIPLMLWYAVESFPAIDPERSVDFVLAAKLPLIREFMSRRVASLPDQGKAALCVDGLLRQVCALPDVEVHRDVLAGIQAGVQGRRQVAIRGCWALAEQVFAKSESTEVRDRGLALGIHFGSKRSLAAAREFVLDRNAELLRRRDVLKSLVAKQSEGLRELLGDLVEEPSMRAAAVRGLAAFNDDRIPPRLLGLYPKFNASERADVVATLSSRPAFALSLLDAVAAKTVDRKDLGPVEIRQLLALKDPKVTARVEEVWGTVRPAAKDKVALMAKYKKLLAADQIKTADHAVGRQMYVKHCAACHKLFGEGGAIGPDLTGSQRANLDYLLENILDPSAVVPREYQVTIFVTKAGRTIAGLVKEENDASVSVQTQNEIVVLPKADIEQRTATKQSMMPDGILEQMSIEEARALVAYLGRATALEQRSAP